MNPTSEDKKLPCAEKLVFLTRQKAQAVATVDAYRYGSRLRVYKCRHCGHWHLSSQPT